MSWMSISAKQRSKAQVALGGIAGNAGRLKGARGRGGWGAGQGPARANS